MLICGDAGIGRQASLRCLCQYWRVGSSPISRTSVKDIRFSSVLYFYIYTNLQISKALSSKKATLESQEIFDFVVEETRFLGVKSMILRKRNLFRRLTKASPRCPSQYWRVGSSKRKYSPCNPQRLQGASLVQPLIVYRLIVFNIA